MKSCPNSANVYFAHNNELHERGICRFHFESVYCRPIQFWDGTYELSADGSKALPTLPQCYCCWQDHGRAVARTFCKACDTASLPFVRDDDRRSTVYSTFFETHLACMG